MGLPQALSCNLIRLLRVVTEGPELSSIAFDEILGVFKKNRCIDLYLSLCMEP